jgi:hypothetical protein
MKEYQLQQSSVYQHHLGDLSSLIRKCWDFLDRSSDFKPVPDDVRSKIQWTVTELLLNGTKHSGVAESSLRIVLYENGLLILKEDSGNPLRINVREDTLLWPLPAVHVGQRFEVYQNGMDSLRIFTVSENKVEFYVTELDDIQMPRLLSSTSEHFGLMIIAKASDGFSYSYDHTAGLNIFSAVFNF